MGALAERLEQELRQDIKKYGTVVWLDRDGHYGSFAAELAARAEAGDFPYPVIGFDGSYLELMLRLQHYGNGLDQDHLLIHMPGHIEATIKQTPVLELYQPGFRFRKALPTLVREAAAGRVDPARVDEFADSAENIDAAERWLEEQLETPDGLGLALQRMDVTAVMDALLKGRATLLGEETTADDLEALRAYFHRSTGVDGTWTARFPLDGTIRDEHARHVDQLTRATGGWALCAEYVHDLRGPPRGEVARLAKLSAPLAKASRRLCEHLRTRHEAAYRHIANETESLLEADLAAEPEVLGDIDTFRFEERAIREGAILCLQNGDWTQTATWATERRVDHAFWLRGDENASRKLRWTWHILRRGAALGEAVDTHRDPLRGAHSLRDALERYTESAYQVDQLHRQFEQTWREMGDASLANYDTLRQAVRRLRESYRSWTDDLARAFMTLCRERGFLPDVSLQQRTLFDGVVQPLTQEGEPVAVFLVDAMRFEMAVELKPDLEGDGAHVDLKARLAELPTITSVGMNALAPVARDGKLDLVSGKKGFSGFRSSEFVVSRPNDRARAMGSRSVGGAALELRLAEVCDMPLKKLQAAVKKASGLLVVHSLEIDDAGEAGVGLATFEHTLRQIRTAAHQLQAAGVGQIVITADHGFLLRDEDAPAATYGEKAERRHILSKEDRREAGTATVSLSDLGYQTDEPGYLIFRDDTQVNVTRATDSRFVHGGNTLQERVIPVLVLKRKRKRGAAITAYQIRAVARPDLMGRRRLRVRLELAERSTATLDFAGAKSVTLELRPIDRPDVDVTIAEVDGPARHEGGRLKVPLGRDWSEVLFSLEGDHDKPTRVEIHHPDATENVAPVTLKEFFAVARRHAPTAKATASEAPPPPPSEGGPAPETWSTSIEDEGFRRVFLYIAEHGSINEADLGQMLGGARKVRRFARQFDGLRAYVPFRVRIDTTGTMKCYMKDVSS